MWNLLYAQFMCNELRFSNGNFWYDEVAERWIYGDTLCWFQSDAVSYFLAQIHNLALAIVLDDKTTLQTCNQRRHNAAHSSYSMDLEFCIHCAWWIAINSPKHDVPASVCDYSHNNKYPATLNKSNYAIHLYVVNGVRMVEYIVGTAAITVRHMHISPM